MIDGCTALGALRRVLLPLARPGLVTTIIALAPINSMKLRSAIDTEAPTADFIWVVSAVSREINSPLRAESKNDGDSETRCANTSRLTSATIRSPSTTTR